MVLLIPLSQTLKEGDIELDDTELIRRMASKDSGALEAFYDRYNRIAFTMVFRIVRIREDAEDILSDVFWQAWQQANRYDMSRGKPIAWLLTIARTRAIDYVRSGKKRGKETEFDSSAPAQSPEHGADPFVLAGLQRAVRLCLEKLAEPQRVALEMAYFEGMSHAEIAKTLNQPLGTMKDRIRTGMMHLRKCLKPYEAPL
jgi:RNA polymerase sigma-70 factor (ECF subfamily)